MCASEALALENVNRKADSSLESSEIISKKLVAEYKGGLKMTWLCG